MALSPLAALTALPVPAPSTRSGEGSFGDAGHTRRDGAGGVTGKCARRTNGDAQRLRYVAEDFADEATYQDRRRRRQVRRKPGLTLGIAAAAIGSFLLIRHVLRDDD